MLLCRGVLAVALVLTSLAVEVLAAPDDVVGEAFGKPVTEREFAYHLKTASIFTHSGQAQRTEEATRQEAWQNLIFVQEAKRLGIVVEDAELATELARLMKEQGVAYPGPAYGAWVQRTMREDLPTFERRVRDLLVINALNRQTAQPKVDVTDEDAHQKFLNERNSFESEYVTFETLGAAEAFAQRLKAQPSLWKETFDRRRAERGQEGAAWINMMSIEAMIDLWKLSKEDAYRVFGHPEGDLVVATQHYGPAVFRLLSKVAAKEEDYTDKQRERYRNMLVTMKQHQSAQAYLDDLVKRAGYRDYVQERERAEEEEKLKVKAAELKQSASIVLETTQGRITLRLWPDVAPKACENFITLAEQGYYNGLTFHRVMKDFMIQGGDPTGTGSGGRSIWGKAFEDETKPEVVFDRPGLLAMANVGPNTNGSQFFITTVPTPWLNGKHTIFGEVVSGMEAVKAIEAAKTDAFSKPLEPQKIQRMSVGAQ